MTMTTFTITSADIGKTIGPPDGYLVDLHMAPGSGEYEPVQWDPGHQRYTGGWVTLKGSGDRNPLYSGSPQSTPLSVLQTGALVVNANFPYTGNLTIEAVPKGASFSITLSDTPIYATSAALSPTPS
jgi:hypothetical protein